MSSVIPPTPQLDIEVAHSLLARIESLTARHHELLEHFWDDQRATFGLERPDEDKPHVVTSATCILSFLDAPRQDLPDFVLQQKDAFVDWLVGVPWISEDLVEHNVYTAPLALSALLALDRTRYADEKPAAAIAFLLEQLEESPSSSIRWARYPSSGYLTYWAARALSEVADIAADEVAFRARNAVEGTISWAEQDVYRQLAFRDMNDYDRFEPMNLAYALALVDLPRERQALPANTLLLTAGLRALFESQLPSGLWQKGLPKFHYERGNVYPFAFEALAAVMRVGRRRVGAQSPDVAADLFAPYVEHLTRTLEWAETHEVRGTVAAGWRSNWLPPGDGPYEPHAWATALVLSFAQTLAIVVRAIMSAEGLRQFRARNIVPPPPESQDLTETNWTTLTTGPAPVVGGNDGDASATQLIFRHLIRPRINDDDWPAWTAVFFGPPGTAKTSLGREIARTLRWPFISIETSDFLEEGADKMGYQARRIFRRLEGLTEAVVLVDEVEEFVKDRQGPSADHASRLITTAMLTLLQGIRDRRRIILILATNHVDTFDRAVLRPGRFDLVLFVAPPSADQKLAWLEEQLKPSAEMVSAFVARSDDVARFSYTEWEIFMTELAERAPADAAVATDILQRWAERLTITSEDWESWKDRVHWVQVRK